MNIRRGMLAVSVSILLCACGGGSGAGGGGPISTPPPPLAPAPTPSPTPSPSPAPTNTSLSDLRVSQTFTNDAVTSNARIELATLMTVESSQSSTALDIRYNAADRSYTVSTGGISETFGTRDLSNRTIPGQIDYEKHGEGISQYFTLTSPGTVENLGVVYVGGGYWQRNRQANNILDIAFDAFTYGFDTPASSVPRTGSAGYAVQLFAFFAPPDRTPKAVWGNGTFSVDFLNGLFVTQGGATEIDLTDPYYTGEHQWRGAGVLGSANSFSGNFVYDGRERFVATGPIYGRFYGPQAQELGAVFHARDESGLLMAGTLLGKASPGVSVPVMTVLPNGTDREYYSLQSTVAVVKPNGSTAIYGGARDFPDAYGQIRFNADGSVQVVPKLSSSALPAPVFTNADRVAADSNASYAVYRKDEGSVAYGLALFQPGPANPEIAFTYASFGRWDRTETRPTDTAVLNTWFVYGVPTMPGTLPRSGNASYSMAIHGNGHTYADGIEYVVGGNAALNVDFSAQQFSGSFAAVATQIGGPAMIDFGPLTFSGALIGSSFQSGLANATGYMPGSIDGRLYGPQGNEAAATWEYIYRIVDGDHAAGYFGGIAIGKKN
jgi:hypothetical protein